MSTLRQAVDDLFNAPALSLDEAMDRHFAPAFRQRTNGQWDSRGEFVARIARLREQVARATVTVLDEHADGARYAERHVIDLALRDGARIVQEVYVFARRDADGRFSRIEEATLALSP